MLAIRRHDPLPIAIPSRLYFDGPTSPVSSTEYTDKFSTWKVAAGGYSAQQEKGPEPRQ